MEGVAATSKRKRCGAARSWRRPEYASSRSSAPSALRLTLAPVALRRVAGVALHPPHEGGMNGITPSSEEYLVRVRVRVRVRDRDRVRVRELHADRVPSGPPTGRYRGDI